MPVSILGHRGQQSSALLWFVSVCVFPFLISVKPIKQQMFIISNLAVCLYVNDSDGKCQFGFQISRVPGIWLWFPWSMERSWCFSLHVWMKTGWPQMCSTILYNHSCSVIICVALRKHLFFSPWCLLNKLKFNASYFCPGKIVIYCFVQFCKNQDLVWHQRKW